MSGGDPYVTEQQLRSYYKNTERGEAYDKFQKIPTYTDNTIFTSEERDLLRATATTIADKFVNINLTIEIESGLQKVYSLLRHIAEKNNIRGDALSAFCREAVTHSIEVTKKDKGVDGLIMWIERMEKAPAGAAGGAGAPPKGGYRKNKGRKTNRRKTNRNRKTRSNRKY